MSFLRVTAAGATNIPDLGISLAAGVHVLSNQFSVDELYKSKDLEALIQASTLTVELDYGVGFSAVSAANYTNRDTLATFMNLYEITNEDTNEKLINGSDVGALHSHDAKYFTKAQLQSTTNGSSGASLIGIDQTPAFTNFTPTSGTIQGALEGIDSALGGMNPTLDDIYANDPDKILDVNNGDLNLRSNNVDDIIISRKSGVDSQSMIQTDVASNEVILGSLASGALSQVNVRVKKDLIVEGNIQYTGKLTDTTVNNLEVTNNRITLNDGQVADVDAFLESSRPVAGANAQIKWNETTDRWEAGVAGTVYEIASHKRSEVVTGIWEMQGGASTDPNEYFTNKAAAPSTNLGSATQIPMAVISNEFAVLDKTRSKWLGMSRSNLDFVGRDSTNNSNEYLRFGGAFTSNQSSGRLERNMTLVGIAVQTNGTETWTARVRKNGNLTNLASLAVTAADGSQETTTNVDFNAGDKIEVYCDGSGINRPVVRLIFAPRFA